MVRSSPAMNQPCPDMRIAVPLRQDDDRLGWSEENRTTFLLASMVLFS